MPAVKPSTTGHGTWLTTRPSRSTPAASTSTPASIATAATEPGPYWATTGTSTTAIAPVGPDTCRWDPPNTAATTPATTAVTSPAAAPTPDTTPNPSASGRATMPTVTPASRSPRQDRDRPA